jgi:hypothetical protein
MRIDWGFVSSAALVSVLSVMAAPAYAGNARAVTYNEDIAPILRKNCETCHRPAAANLGGIPAPMALRTYQETRPWARAIAAKVAMREMPPWFADEPKGVFKTERGLTDEEIKTIQAWVSGGAPEGDPSKALPPSQYAGAEHDGWTLGKPDIVVRLLEPYFVKDDGEDVQGSFHVKLTPAILPRDVFVRAWEFRAPSEPAKMNSAVHHMCGGIQPPGWQPEFIDGEEGGEQSASLGCTAGGAEPFELPDGFGRKLYANGTITMSMHYYKQSGPGTGFKNQPEIGFYLARGPIKHIVNSTSIANRSFEIPAYHPNYPVSGAITLKKDTLLFMLWPHGHLRAKAARYTAFYPDGRKEVLLNVPRYDQAWQLTYQYREPKLLPKGTRVEVVITYDNSAARAKGRIGFKPDTPVWFGPRTQDEMMLGFFTYAELESGAVPATIAPRK